MNVLLLNQFFAPDAAPTGQLLADVADEVARRGHSVTVICARSSYSGAQTADPRAALPGLRVLRTPATRFRRGTAGRLLAYASFYWGALWRALAAPRPDVIVTLTTPPLLCLLGGLVRAVRGGRHYIWEMDVYPDIAVALGVLAPGSRITRAIGALADRSRHRAQVVIALGGCMRDLLAARGIPPGKIRVAENWADGSRIHPAPLPEAPPLTVLYSGNLGLAHDTDTIAEAMERLKDDPRFRFVFAGGGPRRTALERFCAARDIAKAEFLPYQDEEHLSAHFARCQLGLVTQTAGSLGAVVPSKLYAFLAAARPVIFIGPREATPARVLAAWQCGWQIDPGDDAALIQLLNLFAAEPALLARAGGRARRAFLARYDRPAGVARILDILTLESSTSHESSHHRHHWPGRLLSGGISARPRLRDSRP
ncbi:MAG TPA: glycosyltransferase family 4 protein [Bryobacteraceae bacterium]|nr:glycosyltransferase family 4 protein [Bryobacteraceae bacterium]